MHRLLIVSYCFLFIAPVARAQLLVSSSSFQTIASANIGPGCSDNDGDVSVPTAVASCADGMGRTALASSGATASVSTDGATLTVAAEASATATGDAPFQQPNGNASGNAAAGWQIVSGSYYYSLAVESDGDPFVVFSDTGGPLPGSGIITTGFYSLNTVAAAIAIANDANGAEIVVATPESATAEVTFAAVGDPALIQGSVSAFGTGLPGIAVEALDGSQQIVAATTTGLDGSYLLGGLPGPVAVRVTDPGGTYVSQTSDTVTPPRTLDFDLTPGAALPALSGPALVLLCGAIAGLATGALQRRAPRR